MSWKGILLAITIAFVGVIAVMVWNTARMPSTRIDPLIPGFGLAASDARHYARIADALLKFEPVVIREGDSLNPHDTNERLPIDSLARGVVFYQRLIERQGQE